MSKGTGIVTRRRRACGPAGGPIANAAVYNTFNVERHLTSAQTHRVTPKLRVRRTATSQNQQMRWNCWTVQPFLDVRVAALNNTLRGSFRRRYPAFQTPNERGALPLAA